MIAGKYRIERVLGAGGMGVVVAAHHLQLDIPVAVKFLLRGSLESEGGIERFSREARAAAKITNDHVARVFDVGTLDNGSPYIVLEFLDGSDLSSRLRESGPMQFDEAVECVLQACEVLAEAHSLGIVHRDLKPANLFAIRRPDGLPWIKVLDFGISKLLTPGDGMSMTQSATVMGSPMYMSPEQMESSRNVDPRSDIWALGVTLYELLGGRPPFHAESFPELVLKIATQPVPPLRMSRPDCPAALEQAILRCLRRNREERFHDVAGLALALLPFAPERARASVERIARVAQRRDVASATLTAAGLAAPGLSSSVPLLGETATALGHTKGGARGGPTARVVGAIIGCIAVAICGAWFFLSAGRAARKDVAAPHESSTPAASPTLAPPPPPETAVVVGDMAAPARDAAGASSPATLPLAPSAPLPAAGRSYPARIPPPPHPTVKPAPPSSKPNEDVY